MSTGGEAFDRAKAQALVLQPDLNIDKMDFFKVIREGQLVDSESDESEAERVLEKEFPIGQINDDPVDQSV